MLKWTCLRSHFTCIRTESLDWNHTRLNKSGILGWNILRSGLVFSSSSVDFKTPRKVDYRGDTAGTAPASSCRPPSPSPSPSWSRSWSFSAFIAKQGVSLIICHWFKEHKLTNLGTLVCFLAMWTCRFCFVDTRSPHAVHGNFFPPSPSCILVKWALRRRTTCNVNVSLN